MAQARFETLSQLAGQSDKSEQLFDALEELKIEAKDKAFGCEFVRLTGDQLAWSILQSTDHPDERALIIDILLGLLRFAPALVYANSKAGGLLPFLLGVAFDETYHRIFPQVLTLVSALLECVPLGFRLFTRLNNELAEKAGQKPFQHIVSLLGENLDFSIPACRILRIVLDQSILEGQFDAVVAQAKEVDILAGITSARRSATKAPEHVALPFIKELDSLELTCTGNEEQLNDAKIQVIHRSAQNIGHATQFTRLLQTVRDIPLAEAETLSPEEEENDALQEIIQGLDARFEELTQTQQESVDETRQALSETLKKQDKFFTEQLQALKQKTAMDLSAEADKRSLEVMAEVNQIREKQRALTEVMDQSREMVVERQHIHSSQQLWIFYQTVQLKLNEILLAYKVMASRLVANDTKTKAESASEAGVKLLGSAVPLPGFKAASSAITQAMKYRRRRKTKKVAAGVSGLATTVSELERISELCARILALRYEDQLRMCSREGVKKLGQCGVRRILAAIQAGNFGDISDLLSCEDIAHDLVGAIYTDKRLALKKTGIEHSTEKKANWNEESVFQKPGILTPCGKFFSGGDTKPGKYGYRMGSLAEAQALGLKQDILKQESRLCLTDVGVIEARTNLIAKLTRPISAVRIPATVGPASRDSGTSDELWTAESSVYTPSPSKDRGGELRQLTEEVMSLKAMMMKQQTMLEQQAAAIQKLQAV